MTLSSALWRPTSSRTSSSSPVGREQARRVRAARAVEGPLRGAQPLRAALRSPRRRRAGPSGSGSERDLDRVDRGLAADAAGGRHAEVALHELGLERPPQVHRDDVVGLLAELDVGAVLDLVQLERRAQQALGVQEARPRARSRCRACASSRRRARPPGCGPGGADLERLLAGQAVAPLPPRRRSRRRARACRRTRRAAEVVRWRPSRLLLAPPPRLLHVLVAEAPLDAEVAAGDVVVVGARDLHDRIVLHVQLEVAADAAVGADRRASRPARRASTPPPRAARARCGTSARPSGRPRCSCRSRRRPTRAARRRTRSRCGRRSRGPRP